MAWTVTGTPAALTFSEVAAANSKELTTANISTLVGSQFVSELRILGIRIELTTNATVGNRTPVVQIVNEADSDVVFQLGLSTTAASVTDKTWEVSPGTPFSAEVQMNSVATNLGVNCPNLSLAPGQKLKVTSLTGGQSADTYIVHVRCESV